MLDTKEGDKEKTMIQYNADFTALTRTLGSGEVETVDFRDGIRFNELVDIRDKQLSAESENLKKLTNYNQVIKNDQISEDASRPYPAPPVKPTKTLVSDEGKVDSVEFGPGELTTLNVKGKVDVSVGSGKSQTNLPPDPLANMAAQNTVILAQLKLILGALAKANLL